MFCDLADSTRLAQQLDAEDLREVVRAYQATAAAVIQQYAGHIAQYLGDGLLVYFGWPVAHEDDALRGVHAGLGIVAAITTTLNPRLQREKGVQLAVRVGLHTGPVVVGEMGGGGRHEHLATGDTVNIAARLEGLAAPNTVVISQVTARLVRQAVGLEDLGRQALKGVTEPMPVFRVRGPLETQADQPAVAGVPFLVGRDEELGVAAAALGAGQGAPRAGGAAQWHGGHRQIRPDRGAARPGARRGCPASPFRCSAYHQHSALYPVITHVERVLDVQREDAPATKLDKLEQGLRPYRLPLDEVVPLFAALLSVPLDGRYAAPTLSPQQQKQQTLDALVAWMLEEAERQPVLVAWEDLHWADPSTLEMLGLVLEQTPTVPMLHVLTFRPEFTPPWPMRSHLTPITLNRLERSSGRGADHAPGGGQAAARRGGAAHCGQDGWGAALCRRADQDAAAVGPAAGGRGPLHADRAAGERGDSRHLAGCAHGPPGSAPYRQRGGAGGGGAGAGVCLRDAPGPSRRRTRRRCRRGWRSWSGPNCCTSGGGRHGPPIRSSMP